MTRHLIDAGHERIAYISGPLHLSTAKGRLKGFRECLEMAGFTEEPLILHGDFQYDTGYSYAREIVDMEKGITCIYCSNDLMALGAMKCLFDLGLRVPEHIAVAGFDDIPMSSLTTPALTHSGTACLSNGSLGGTILCWRG